MLVDEDWPAQEMDTHEPGPDATAYVADGESGATALAQRWNSPLLVDVNECTLLAVLEHPGLLETLAQIEDFRALVDNAEHVVTSTKMLKKANARNMDARSTSSGSSSGRACATRMRMLRLTTSGAGSGSGTARSPSAWGHVWVACRRTLVHAIRVNSYICARRFWGFSMTSRPTAASDSRRLRCASAWPYRLVRDGYLDRVAPGAYAPRPLGMLGTRAASQDPALAVAAAFGTEPHRIAYRSALDHHGLLSHPVRTLQVAFPRRVKVREVSGRRLQAIFELQDTIDLAAVDTGSGARVSSVERALLECAHRSGLAGGWTILGAAVSDGSWDPDRLAALADRLGLAAALRRIGSLAERDGQTDRVAALPLPDARARVIDLDPRQPADDPWVDPRWRVRWPTVPERTREQATA
jgi:predicted transcriptional regulator of viral defense system